MKKAKKFLSLFLVLVMCLSMVNLTVFAAEETTNHYCVKCVKTTAFELVPRVEPTCQQEGAKEHYRCTVCGTKYHHDMITIYTSLELLLKIDKVSCDYSIPATCTSAATCKWCGDADPNGQVNPDNHTELCYTDNGDGTHDQVCDACEETVVNDEAHNYVDGVCAECGAEEPEHEHDYTWADNGNGTHTGTCGCEDAVTEEHVDEDEDEVCDKCEADLSEPEPDPEPEDEHTYTWVDNEDGTHTGTCDCEEADATVTEEHVDEDEDEVCDKCEADLSEPDPKPDPDPDPVAVAKIVRNGEDVTFETLQAAVKDAKDNETVILLVDVTENVTAANKDITLDLDGNTVTGTGNGTVLTINGGSVTLTGDGTITGGHSTVYTQGGGVTVDKGGVFTMKSGKIDRNTANQYGGGVLVYNGQFVMDGGEITNNLSDVSGTGGGVSVYNCIATQSAQFVMNGGTISGNSNNAGGGVGAFGYKQDEVRTVVIINGGTITGNTAVNGGGVSVSTADAMGTTYVGRFEINGGTISGNTANQGGGVYSAVSVAEITGGKITGNTATGTQGYGGGVYVQAGEATLTGATITGNNAIYGGGVFAGAKEANTTVTMTSGELYGNTATSMAADVYTNNLTTLTLPAASGMLNGKTITGWYWDGSPRWTGEVNDRGSINATVRYQYLIAAYDWRDPVAKIVETGAEYTTLQAAVDAAENGQTVEVLKSTTGASLTATKSITVDIPAGVTVSDVSGKTYALAVGANGAELTITGAGTLQGGTYGAVAQQSGKLTVDMVGGTITSGKYGIYAVTQSATTVKNGNVAAGQMGIYATSKVTVEGGTISGKMYGLAAGSNATIEVTGGTIEATPDNPTANNTAAILLQKGPQVTVKGDAVIRGGYVGVSVSGYNAQYDATQTPTTFRLEGNASVTGEMYGVSGVGSWDNTKIIIEGGSIESKTSTAIYHPQVGDMTISGGTITGKNGVQYSGAGKLTITGGKIIATMEYTEFPLKAPEQGDGTVADGAALSIVSRGGGWQEDGQFMEVEITGGTLISENNSAVSVYRIKQGTDKVWTVGDATGLPSYLKSMTIKEGEDGSIPVFIGNPDKGVLDIESLAMDAKNITGGTFSEDIDAGEINYVAEGYESHEIESGCTYAGYFNVHQPAYEYGYDADNHWQSCSVENCAECENKEAHTYDDGVVTTEAQIGVAGVRTFTCTVCGHSYTEPIPALSASSSGTTYYNLTINYVDEDGNVVAPAHSQRLASGRTYSVASPAVEGMTPDQETVSGTLSRNTTITVVYTAVEDVNEPETPLGEEPGEDDPSEEPTEDPGEEDLNDPDVPLSEQPEDPGEELEDPDVPLSEEPTETEEPTEDPGEEELEDPSVPLDGSPETGDSTRIALWSGMLLASGLGLVVLNGKKKEDEEEA